MTKKTIHLLILLGVFFHLSGQTKSGQSPYNFLLTSKTYHFSQDHNYPNTPFFTMCELADGAVIFGNIDGALVRSGEHLQKITLPNNSAVTCLLEAKNGTIYAGGYNTVGTIQKNSFGDYFYKSLRSDFQFKNIDFNRIKTISECKEYIIFKAALELVIFTKNKMKLIPSKKEFVYGNSVRNNYFVQDKGFGLYKLNSNTMLLELIFNDNTLFSEQICSVLPTADPNIIQIISRNGIVFWGNLTSKTIIKKSNVFEGSEKDIVSTAVTGNNGECILGTENSNIITLTNSGYIIKKHKLHNEDINTPIVGLFKAKNNNIWVLQMNKVSVFEYALPYRCLYDKGPVKDVLIKDNLLYIASNNRGIYYADFLNASKYKIVNLKKIESPYINPTAIQYIENDIIVSDFFALYKIQNNAIQQIGGAKFIIKLIKINSKKGWYLGAANDGLYLVEKKDETWAIKNKITGFDESCRDILAGNNPDTYWISQGYKGVFKIHCNFDYSTVDAVEQFTNKNGIKNPYNINAFNWNKKIVFTTNNGIYTYNERLKKFELFAPLNTILGTTKNIRSIVQYKNKTWFIQDDEAGYFIGTNPKLYKDLFANLKGSFIRGKKNIYPLDNNTVLFGTNTGLWLYTLTGNQNKTVLKTVISRVMYTVNQKKQYAALDSKKNTIELPNRTTILHFEFAVPKMASSSDIQYRYKLENADKSWSPWQKEPYCVYKSLSHGNYTLTVMSRNLVGDISKQVVYEFKILPKWYETKLIFILYLFTLALFVYATTNYVLMKLANNKKKSLKILNNQIETYNLRVEKKEFKNIKTILEDDVLKKNKEIAIQTIKLSKKKDFLVELKKDLTELRGFLKSEESRRKITEIFQKLNQHKINEEYTELFDVPFKELNSDLFEKLTAIDPTLTNREKRLCTYIQMELSNKEIGQLFFVSSRTIENMRTKLRKKFGVQREENFSTFLLNLDKSGKE